MEPSTSSDPPVSSVELEYVFVPVRVCEPMPALMRLPLPSTTPANVPSLAESIVSVSPPSRDHPTAGSAGQESLRSTNNQPDRYRAVAASPSPSPSSDVTAVEFPARNVPSTTEIDPPAADVSVADGSSVATYWFPLCCWMCQSQGCRSKHKPSTSCPDVTTHHVSRSQS